MIELKNVTKTFKKPIRGEGLLGMVKTLFSRKYEYVKAVKDISFTINDGEIVGYIGSNGAGKSTTIKMMSGILTPTSGKVLIDGKEPYNPKYRTSVVQNIGVVFGQRTQLWWDLPLIESLKILKLVYNVSDKDYNERFNYFNELLELDKFMKTPVRSLSLGQRMRADLVASLLHNPKILFLDEPTIGLDVLVKQKIIYAIKEINKKYNTTVILTTHDMGDMTELCNRVILIDEGKLLYDGSIERLRDKFGDLRFIYVSTTERIDLDKFNNEFNNLLEFSKDSEHLIVQVNIETTDFNDVLSYIINNYNIKDFKIKENNIENVVRGIYEAKQI